MHYRRPASTETIICLANSRKFGGRCIAGKRADDARWLRPVTARPGQEITESIRRYADGSSVQVLDVFDCTGIGQRPSGHQTENFLVHGGYRWKKQGSASWNDVLDLVDPAADLWVDNYSSYYNCNNRVPARLLDTCEDSLRLIALEEMVLHVGYKAQNFGESKLVVRASFDYRGQHYQLNVTDPVYEHACREKGPGEYVVHAPVVCISLSEPFHAMAYKLVASIITQERAMQ